MDLQLKGKRVVVTGASKGIGRACAVAFAKEGVDTIHAVARYKADLEILSKSINDTYGANVKTYPSDVTDKALRDDLISKTEDIDILINNAGAIPSGSIYGVSEKEVILIMRKNLKPNSFKNWRKRVSGRKLKHEKKFKLTNKLSF